MTGCYGGETEPQLGTRCSAGIGTLDPDPGDCVVIRDNPLTPGCSYGYSLEPGELFHPGGCAVFRSDGARVYMQDAQVTYGPLAPLELCSCVYVSRSR